MCILGRGLESFCESIRQWPVVRCEKWQLRVLQRCEGLKGPAARGSRACLVGVGEGGRALAVKGIGSLGLSRESVGAADLSCEGRMLGLRGVGEWRP